MAYLFSSSRFQSPAEGSSTFFRSTDGSVLGDMFVIESFNNGAPQTPRRWAVAEVSFSGIASAWCLSAAGKGRLPSLS